MDKDNKKLKVGLVMPIALIDGLDASHWLEVKKIITDALDENGGLYEFETKIVSEGDSVGLIHKRIVQGLYTSDIVICDVSCRNPNVMFELGMRLAFDKPTIIIKDEQTNFTFDAGVIEHLEYPRDLRFGKIIDFKTLLANKVIATYEDSQMDPEHSPFLKSYGPFQSVNIEQTEVPASTMIIDILNELQADISSIKSNNIHQSRNFNINNKRKDTLLDVMIFKVFEEKHSENLSVNELVSKIKKESMSRFYSETEIEMAIINEIKNRKNIIPIP